MIELELAFKIGSFFSKTQSSFQYGPNPLHEQTDRGIVLEMRGESDLRRIHTPLGFWNVGATVQWEKFPAEVVLIPKESVTRGTGDLDGRLLGVVAWEGASCEPPVYRKPDLYWSKEKVQGVWDEFREHKKIISFFPLM